MILTNRVCARARVGEVTAHIQVKQSFREDLMLLSLQYLNRTYRSAIGD
jgi:hypothetical protein